VTGTGADRYGCAGKMYIGDNFTDDDGTTYTITKITNDRIYIETNVFPFDDTIQYSMNEVALTPNNSAEELAKTWKEVIENHKELLGVFHIPITFAREDI
jgi:hypothetical protein